MSPWRVKRLARGQLLEINRIVVVYLLTYISQSADYLRVRSSLVPSVACQTTEGEYHLLTTTLHLLIPCSYLQVYTNIIVACQTTEVTYRSLPSSFLQATPSLRRPPPFYMFDHLLAFIPKVHILSSLSSLFIIHIGHVMCNCIKFFFKLHWLRVRSFWYPSR